MPERSTSFLSLPGRGLLDRRLFLGDFCRGMSGIALAALLAEQNLLAETGNASDQPPIRPDASLAPRQPHFMPKAKRVLHVFCTGAVSHLDTWDYKPELTKRHGQPMPGMAKLITFQGENGNLAQSPWKFRGEPPYSAKQDETFAGTDDRARGSGSPRRRSFDLSA